MDHPLIVRMDLEWYDLAYGGVMAVVGRGWLPIWWAALGLALGALIVAPLELAAFGELLLAVGAAFAGLRALGPRLRHFPDLRWFVALVTATTVAATATSLIWASPAAAAVFH
jgi:hypothetical protein